MVSTNEAHKTALSVSLIQERRHCCDTPLWLLPAGKLNVARNLRVRFGCHGAAPRGWLDIYLANSRLG